MTRALAISLVIAIVFGSWGWFLANSRAGTIKDRDAKIASQDIALQEKDLYIQKMEGVIATYAEADENAKHFEKELNDDTNVDNLEVVPADYILRQLRTD